jgi:uncharacterized protein YjbJ (UPF0337 family)
MEITEKQLEERLNNPQNLANRFRNGRIYAEISEGGISTSETEEAPCRTEEQESECLVPLSTEIKSGRNGDGESQLTHRIIKRPGNCRPWLSKSERTGIALAGTNRRGGRSTQTQQEIAKAYGVQVSTVSDITNNVRRIEDGDRHQDQGQIDQVIEDAKDAAINRLMASLGQITDDKISAHTAKDISSIAANMAKVVKDISPDKQLPQSINLIVYTPELRNEKTYEVVEI